MSLVKTFSLNSVLLGVLLLSACGGHVYHRVERGETLYSIGWVYGYDYREIARWNNIPPPYALNPGQRLRVAPPSGQNAAALEEPYSLAEDKAEDNEVIIVDRNPAPVVSSAPESNKGMDSGKVVEKSHSLRDENPAPAHDAESVIDAAKTAAKRLFNQTGLQLKNTETFSGRWRWPTSEKRILRTFSANDPSRQGLDIAGEIGDPVMAAAAGRVVYAGSGLVRYGRLIIIKHNEKFLSAYAHNQKLLVKEGDVVNAGERIADMGRSGSLGENLTNGQRAKLHFEIRRNGKPIDPKRYLPR